MQAGILLCLLMTAGCASEEALYLESQNENTFSNLMEAKKWYSEKGYPQKVNLFEGDIKTRGTNKENTFFINPSWKYFAVNENKNIKTIEVEVTDAVKIAFLTQDNEQKYKQTNDKKYLYNRSRLVFIYDKVKKSSSVCIMTIIPSALYRENHDARLYYITYLKRKNDFDGIILFHNIDGTFANGWRYSQGKIVSQIMQKSKIKISDNNFTGNILPINIINTSYKVLPSTRTFNRDPEKGDDNNYGWEIELPEFVVTAPGSIPEGGGIREPFNPYFPVDPIIDMPNFPGGTSGEYNGGGGSYTPPANPTPVVDKDESFEKYPEVKKIYDCVIGKETALVKDLLSRYIGKEAPFNLTFKIGKTDSETATGECGIKKGDTPYNITIMLNEKKINRSSVEIIRTMLRESMHAYMHSYLYSQYTNKPEYAPSRFDSVFCKFEYEIKRKEPYLSDQQHHDFMGGIIKNMADELYQLHKTQEKFAVFWNYVGISNETDKKMFYEALAWEGLEESSTYKSIAVDYKDKLKKLLSEKKSLSKLWECK